MCDNTMSSVQVRLRQTSDTVRGATVEQRGAVSVMRRHDHTVMCGVQATLATLTSALYV